MVALLLGGICFGQQDSLAVLDTTSVATSKLKTLAKSAERNQDIYTAIDFYEEYRLRRPLDFKTAFHLAQLKDAARDYKGALALYQEVEKEAGGKHPKCQYHIGRMLKMLGKYDQAQTAFSDFKKGYKGAKDYSEMRKLVESEILGCDSAKLFMQEQLNVEIGRLPDAINKPHIEFNPLAISPSELIFGSLPEEEVRRFYLDSIKPKRQFFRATLEGEDWTYQGKWDTPFNIEGSHTGNGSFSPDGKRFYFAKCDEDWQGKVTCELYVSERLGNNWSEAQSLGEEVNLDGFTSTQPTVGTESRKGYEIIYFVSNRPEGRGGKDIWYTIRDERKGIYKAPKNLGRTINSAQDELTPFYDNDTRKLYFSSNGHAGLGGMDIFSARGDSRKWIARKNMGYPINTSVDEQYLSLMPGGEKGFFTSNRSGGNQMFHATCCDDIYQFAFREFVALAVEGQIVDIPEELYLEGAADALEDLSNYPTLSEATIRLFLKEEGGEVLMKTLQTDSEGRFSLPLEVDQSYRIEVVKDGYFSNYAELNTTNYTYSDTLTRNMGISTLKEGAIVIPSIYYDFDSADLTQAARDKIFSTVLQVLQENPTIKVEIGSHTDSKGTDSYNKKLSQQRAQSVVDYLIENGIDKKRLKAKGYGESTPIAANKNPDGSDNPEGRQMNRRTDFRITGYLKEVIYEIED